MRQVREPGWEDYRCNVPLTGREPLLGRLRLKLRCRPGSGWIGLAGPRGAGISRILAEIYAVGLEPSGAPAPLWVAPCEPGAARGESLRRALALWGRVAPDAALEAALAPVVPTGQHGARAFLAWVRAGPLAAAALLPAPSVLRAAFGALTQGGLVCADDWTYLDATTRSVLRAVARGGTTSVIAGHVDADETEADLGPVWRLDPLTEGQMGLLLKRWLRSPVTARRLASDLARKSEGWPGRAVALVRSLARAGVIVNEARGARLAAWPAPWPEPHGTFESCLQRLKDEDAGGWRVVEAAALVSEPYDPDLLADAAGVKRQVVDTVLAELLAARAGHAPGCVLGDPALRALVRGRMAPARRAQVAERLVHAHERRPLAGLLGTGDALARLEAACEGAAGPELERLLPRVLELAPRRATLVPAVAEMLARAARRLLTLEGAPAPEAILGVAERLALSGHLDTAQELLDALPVAPGSSAQTERLTLRVRYGDGARNASDVGALEQRLAGAGLDALQRHRAWRALAEREGAAPADARRAWRHALSTLPACDLSERVSLHLALARTAERGARRRALACHARRAAVLQEALGNMGEAASLWQRVGHAERHGGRLELASAAFEAAARDCHLLGESALEVEALQAQAQVSLLRARYDEAAGLLTRALASVAEGGLSEHRADLHLDLARAHRGRGDVAQERQHAAQALAHAGTTGARLAAAASQLVSAMRAGVPGALDALEAAARELETAGLRAEAEDMRAAAADARLVIGDVAAAERLVEAQDTPQARLAKARVLCLKGHPGACVHVLETLGRDARVAVEVRAEALVRLAELQVAQAETPEALRSAQAAEDLLEVPHRSRHEDARLHRLLARVYRGVGETARSARHRVAARAALRLPPPSAASAGERLRWVRARWGRDRRHVASSRQA